MQITVLMENTTRNPALTAEHGLSLLIRYRGSCCLLDAGASGAFARNARLLGVDLRRVKYAILSHGHYDHGGGLAAFCQQNTTAPIYAMESAAEPYCSGDGMQRHDIGLPDSVYPRYADRFCWIRKACQPAPGVTLLPHTTPGLAQIGQKRKLYRGRGEEVCPDDFRHELTAVFETEAGLVVCNSCSHAGVPAILQEVAARFPGRKIRAFVGGLHMRGKAQGEEICVFSPGELQALADSFRHYQVEEIDTGHCTGAAGYRALQPLLAGTLHPLETGTTLTFEGDF